MERTRTISQSLRKTLAATRAKPANDGLPEGWKASKDEDGTPYYWSTITGSVTYDMPLELPPGWRITRDAKTRIVYFYNESTRETRQFRDPPPDSQEAYKLLVAGLPPPPPGAPVPFRRGSSSIIALSYAMRFVHKLKNHGEGGPRELRLHLSAPDCARRRQGDPAPVQ